MKQQGKIILLSRVSTGQQDLDQQTEKLIQHAHSLGFSDSDIVLIEDKESAVKLTEEERNGLNKMKDTINAGYVTDVLVYELSRIARVPKVLYSIRDFLISKNVQLHVMNPSFKLLKDDGSIDESANVIFSLFCSMAENEGYLRKQRFSRGKAKMRANGQQVDGPAPFGYSKDKSHIVTINEDEASIVRRIFYEYNVGTTAEQIAKSLIAEGVIDKSLSSAVGFVLRTLHNVVYCGRSSKDNKFYNKTVKVGYTYPPIISEELFDSVDATFKKKGSYVKTKSKYVWLCRGILKDKFGNPFRVHTSHDTYFTYATEDTDDERKKTFNINRELVDNFIWEIALKLHNERPLDVGAAVEDLNLKIKESEVKIADIDNSIAESNDKILRIESRIINGKLNEDVGDEMQQKIHADIKKMELARASEVMEIDNLRRKISILLSNEKEGHGECPVMFSDDEKADIVRMEIKSIIALKEGRAKFKLIVMTNIADDPTIYTIEKKAGNSIESSL